MNAALEDYKIPPTIGECADELYNLREKRLGIQRQVDAISKKESALKAHIINTLPKSNASGVQGSTARVTVEKKSVPQVTDEEKFRKYVNRTKLFHLATKLKPKAPAIRELWEDGREVPGVGEFKLVTVSLNKI